MLHHDGQHRTFEHNLRLAGALGGVAGAVNATGFFVVGEYTSHVTGNVARIGDGFASGNHGLALHALWLVACFFAGAVSASVAIEISASLLRAKYTLPVALEVLVLLAFTTISAGEGGASADRAVLASLLCFAMGLQNALVTRISSAVVRTTHLTGVVTDIAIELVHIVLSNLRRENAPPRTQQARKNLQLHVSIFASFLLGSTVLPFLYVVFGPIVMLVPCAILVLLIGIQLSLAPAHKPDAS